MNFEYLVPVDEALLMHSKLLSNKSIGQCIEIYTTQGEFATLDNKKIAIIGLQEDRGAVGNYGTGNNFDEILCRQPENMQLVFIFQNYSWLNFLLGTYDVEDIDPFLCTHLMYGFAGLHSDDFTIKVLGSYLLHVYFENIKTFEDKTFFYK